MRVLSIDPGYDRMGIAVLEGDPSRPTLIWSDCIVPPKGEKEERLAYIKEALEAVLDEHQPGVMALETLFFSTNKTTALGVAEARGVALAAAGARSLPVREYSPGTVKVAVTGDGRADKKAVASMVPRLVKLPVKKRLDDELDAIAVGITALSDRYPHA